MRIVAIGASDQPFIDAVVKRHVELRFLLQMARVAQLGLLADQKMLFLDCVVRGMARSATHFVLSVKRIDGMHLLRAG